MGNPLSPVLSDIYMHFFETKLFSLISLPFYVRYVDDCFVLLDPKLQTPDYILSIMNSIDPSIQFTYETETDNRLPFLDVLVSRNGSTFETSVYRKPFAVSLPPHFNSSHPPKQKFAAFNTYVHRAIKICSNQDLLNAELNYLRAVAIDRGFSPKIVDRAVTKFSTPRDRKPISDSVHNLAVIPYYPIVSSKIAKILKKFNFKTVFVPINKLKFTNTKDKIPVLNNWGIYQIFCQCGLSYIGQTKRALKIRLNEHRNNVKKQDIQRSSIAEHSWSNGHVFDFDSAKIIQKCSSSLDLDFFETFHIRKNSDVLVNDLSVVPTLPSAWSYVLGQHNGAISTHSTAAPPSSNQGSSAATPRPPPL